MIEKPYAVLDNAIIEELFRIIFERAQGVVNKIFDTVPTTDEISEGEEVYYISGTTYRKYVKLNGALYYWALTAA